MSQFGSISSEGLICHFNSCLSINMDSFGKKEKLTLFEITGGMTKRLGCPWRFECFRVTTVQRMARLIISCSFLINSLEVDKEEV